uniref:Uncharacterized protein n=1 Tax=viral metagenome TaxID=1070528 RepID=A0A6C0K8W3_9ZZZZ
MLVIIVALILLLAFIILSAYKLSIYFNTFLFLSKKINYDKTNYMSNSSFFKYFYTNKMFYGFFGIEFIITVLLVALSLLAYAGYVITNHMNFGYLNNNYGGSVEFAFVNTFLYIIFVLAFIYGGAYMYWYNYDKGGDNKLYEEEARLKTLLLENLDYDLLYDYYLKTMNDGKYELGESYVISIKDANYFANPNNVFKYSLTYYILNDAKFSLIKSDILDIVKEVYEANPVSVQNKSGAPPDSHKGKIIPIIIQQIKDKQDFYIIARYNHNNNIALRPLDALIYDLTKIMKDSSADAPHAATHKTNLKAILDKMKEYKDSDTIEMMRKYDSTQKSFMVAIKLYKEIYDNYYMYYMYSVLLTNFVIIYAVLIFAYMLIKICVFWSKEFDDNYFNIYNFTCYLNNYGIYLLLIYYFISCPIILFGFN